MRFFRSNTNFAHHVSFLSWVGGVSSHILPAVSFSHVISLTPVPEKKAENERIKVSRIWGDLLPQRYWHFNIFIFSVSSLVLVFFNIQAGQGSKKIVYL